ncbi:hypothetical protein [Nissabacter sp. SGAir0207]|uniref:hypothetical protein n=1 Tax=Nissabacter sp. SGAir0207 TaxID=2126321 RepID=UPI0010CD3FE9|nr:hypothetical protein [Nissabacter sp. SGAir0207]QCR38764.1 hypothetical protein C1N62_21795 [Nissabacter sp. SGAir0207]
MFHMSTHHKLFNGLMLCSIALTLYGDIGLTIFAYMLTILAHMMLAGGFKFRTQPSQQAYFNEVNEAYIERKVTADIAAHLKLSSRDATPQENELAAQFVVAACKLSGYRLRMPL